MPKTTPWGVIGATGLIIVPALIGCSDDAGESNESAAGATSGGSSSAGATSGGSSSAGTSSGGGNAAGGETSSSGGKAGAAGASNGGAAGGSECAPGTLLQAPVFSPCPASGTGEPAAALAAVNEIRAHMGLGCMALVAAINTSAQKHCDYYQQNIDDDACTADAHSEVESCAGFVAASFAKRMTDAGYTGSPRSEVMAFSGNPTSAIEQWVNSVYHRTPLLSPWIRDMGYGKTEDCDTIDMGEGEKTADSVTAVYPYPGQTDVPLRFDGRYEGPMPPTPPTGWPSASPIHLYAKGITVSTHEVFAEGSCAPLAHQWLPDKSQYILYPDAPFQKGTTYRVKIVASKGGAETTFEWTFTTEN